MRFFKKLSSILGLGKDDPHQATKDREAGEEEDEEEEGDHGDSADDVARCNQEDVHPIPLGPRRGFGVPIQVPVERPSLGPIVVPCNGGDGGVQGLRWNAKRLKIDEDGDVADEFIDQRVEDATELPSGGEDLPAHSLPLQLSMPRFQVKRNVRPAKVREQVMTNDGKFRQCVYSQGRLQWV